MALRIGQAAFGLKAQHSVPDEMEFVVDIVSSKAAEQIKKIIDLFMPDGRAFGEEKLTTEQQLIQYVLLMQDPQGWVTWAMDAYNKLEAQLADIPYDVRELEHLGHDDIRGYVVMWAAAYKAKMDALLAKALQEINVGPEPEMVPAAEPVTEGVGYGMGTE